MSSIECPFEEQIHIWTLTLLDSKSLLLERTDPKGFPTVLPVWVIEGTDY